MGILDLFRNRDEVHGTKVLVCSFDNRFEGLLKGDSEIYGRYYRATTTLVLPRIDVLLNRLEEKYDVVHLMGDVSEKGTITDACEHQITGRELIQRCCDQGVKLLWSASDNPPQGYIKGFGARGKHLNLVMTLKRKGPNFASFLERLLSCMARGDTMPVAWNHICPQIPGRDHPEAPESIFFAGRGGVKLLA